jgi:hypothetical protein
MECGSGDGDTGDLGDSSVGDCRVVACVGAAVLDAGVSVG